MIITTGTLADVDTVNGDISITTTNNMIATAVDTTASGNITLNAGGVLTAAHVYSLDGSVDLDAGGTLTATDVQANDSGATGAYNVALDTSSGGMVLTSVASDNDITGTAAGGDITIGAMVSGNNTSLTATAGSVNETGAGDAAVDITAAGLTLTARDEIGGAGELDIETTVATMDISSTNAGAVVLTETDGVTLTDVDTVTGDITIVSGGAMTATAVDTTASGNITLNAGGTLTAAHVYSLDGSVDLDAAGTLTATDVRAADSAATGDYNITLDTSAGGMVLTAVTADNDITGTATAGDITIGAVGSGNNTSLTATAGSINETGAGDAAVDITAAGLTLTARDEIGGAGELDIETTVATMNVSSTNAGAVVLTETDGVTLTDVDAVTGDITIVSGGAMTASLVDTTTSGSITLNAGGALDAAHVYSLDGSVDLDAGGTLTATDVRAVDSAATGAYNVALDTSAGGMVLTAVTADNDIAGTATAGDITIGAVGSGNNTSLTATAGSINETGGGDAAVDITAAGLTLTARDEIGGAGELDIETTVATMDISSTNAGAVVLTETDGVTLTDIDTQNGSITINAGGAVTATDVRSLTDNDANDITITTSAGDISAGILSAGTTGDISLTANTVAGQDVLDLASAITCDVLTIDVSGNIGDLTTFYPEAGFVPLNTTAVSLDLTSGTGVGAGSVIAISDSASPVLTRIDADSGDAGTALIKAVGSLNGTAVLGFEAADDIGLVSTGGGGTVTVPAGMDAATLRIEGNDLADSDGGDIDLDAVNYILVSGAGESFTITTNGGWIDAETAGALSIANDGGPLVVDDNTGSTFGLRTTAAGDLQLSSVGDISFTADGNVSVFGGNLTIWADSDNTNNDGAVTMAAGSAIDAGAGTVDMDSHDDITLTSVVTTNATAAAADIASEAGDIVFDSISTGAAGGITITATAGSVNEGPAEAAVDLSCGDLTITAAGNIGWWLGGQNIETDVATMDISSTNAGVIVLVESDGVTLSDIDTVNGSIDIRSGGNTEAVDVRTTDGDISLSASVGDLTIGEISAPGAPGNVVLTVTAGSVDEIGAGDANVDISSSGVLTINARDEIGSAANNPGLEIDTPTLVAHTTAALGHIVIDKLNAGALSLSDVDAVSGNINITSSNAMTASSVDTTTSGSITLNAGGTLDADHVYSLDGSVDLDAGGTLTATDVRAVDSAATGAYNVALDTSAGGMVLTAVTADNDITGTAVAGDITIGAMVSGNNTSLTATAGSINETGAGDAAVDITAAGLTLTARDEIGGAGELDIETTVATMDISSTNAGAVVLTETDGVTLTDVDTVTGDITIVSGGATTASLVDTTASGSITLNAGGTLTAAHVYSLDGSVDLDAAGTLTSTDVRAVDSAATGDYNITLDTSAGGMVLTAALADNDITGTAIAGDITIGALVSGNNTSLTAAAGSINETGAGDAAVDITAAGLTLTARDEIGGAGELDIETTVATMNVSSTNAGAVVLTETDGVTLTDVDAVTGDITIVSGGAMTASLVDTTTSGSITLNAGGALDAAHVYSLDGSVDLDAGGTLTATDVRAVDSAATGAYNVALDTSAGGMVLTAVTADNDIAGTATAGDITIGAMVAGNNTSLTATAGSINETGGGDAAVDITAAGLTLTARDEIGGAGELDIETTVATMNVSSTNAGSIVLTETDGVTLTNIDAQNGSITINAGGTVTAVLVDSSNTNNDANDITITTTAGDIEAVRILGGAGQANDVILTAAGAVTDGGGADPDITGDLLQIDAVNGIGSGGAVETAVASIDIDNTTAGNIEINETDAVSVIQADQDGVGTVSLLAGGDITLVSGMLGVSATSGDVTINAGVNTIHLDATVLTTGGNISLRSPTEVGANVVLTTGLGAGDVALGDGAADPVTDDGGGRNLEIFAGAGDISVPGILGGGVNDFNDITMIGNDITLTGIGDAAEDGANGAVTVTSADNGPDLGRITLTGSHYRTGGTQSYTGGTDAIVTSLGGNGEFNASAAISFLGPALYLDHNGRTLTMLCDFSVSRLVFYRGTLNVNGRTLTTAGDLAVFGGAYDPDDGDRAGAPTVNEFAYPEAGALAYYPNGGVYTAATGAFSTAPNAVLSALNGSTLTVGGDFYVNGTNMNAGAGWTLNVQDNTSADPVGSGPWGSPYAAAFNMSVSNCSAVTGGNISASTSVAAGDVNNNVVDGGGNQAYAPAVPGPASLGWDFDRPEIVSVETVYDNMVRITFSEPIENSNNEIAAAVAQVQFDGDTVPFTGTFFDSDGDQSLPPHVFVSTNGRGDLQTFFLQVNTGETWNTDATGLSAGDAMSTDRVGQHQAVIPDIDMLKGVFFDAGGHNMVKNYGENGEAVFSATTDECRPALVNVVAGRAEHRLPAADLIYDAHNYFHLRYSEPVDIGTAAGFTIADTTAENVRAESTFAAAGEHGGSITDSGTTVGLTGYFTYSGRLPNGARDGLPGAAFYRGSTNGENPSGPHGLTVYIAGYRADDAAGWPGYIGQAGVDDASALTEAALTAVGKSVSVSANTFITDADGNSVEPSSDGYDAWRPTIEAPAEADGSFGLVAGLNMPAADYSGWEVEFPSFSKYDDTGSFVYYEIVSRATSGTGLIDRLEFFIRDDSTMAWAPEGADHPDADPNHGVRDTSCTDVTAFEIGDVNASSLVSTYNNGYDTIVDNTLFGNRVADDDPYFTLNIQNTGHGWSPLTELQITYDSSIGLITDLAGNLLPSTVAPIRGIERITPKIALTLASVGDNKIYVKFSEAIFGVGATSVDSSDFSISGGTNTITSVEPIAYLDGGLFEAWFHLNAAVTADSAFSGKIVPIASSVEDKIGNLMLAADDHRITDVGIGVFVPVWASDNIHNTELYGRSDKTLRIFDGTGYLMDSNLTIEASVMAGSFTALSGSLIFDVAPPESVVSDGFWLPSFNSTLVPRANLEARSVSSFRTLGGVKDFMIPGEDPEIVTGSTVEFLLRLGDLFCADITDPEDPRTLIPWKFSLKDITKQTAGVTILNNVINPENGEKTILTYDLATSGMVVINVFNLAGDLVNTLHRGAQGAGTYYYSWDGTNRAGNNVARGVYFIRIVAPGIDEFRKVMIVK